MPIGTNGFSGDPPNLFGIVVHGPSKESGTLMVCMGRNQMKSVQLFQPCDFQGSGKQLETWVISEIFGMITLGIHPLCEESTEDVFCF